MLKNGLFGMLTLIIGVMLVFSFAACENDAGGGKPPEQLSPAERWAAWVENDSTATLDVSVDNNGVCTIIVGGTAMPPLEADGVTSYWNSVWKANAQYKYTAAEGKVYTYTFEAWTDSGERALVIQYYEDNDEKVYLSTGYESAPPYPPRFKINSTRQEYSIVGETIPKSGVYPFSFQCANQTGTFYVKIISIEETDEPEENGTPVTFGTGDGETQVNGGDGTTVTYDAGAYVLDYGSKTYGNVIARFKVDLGSAKLGDYKKVTFTWTGVSGDVTSYKRFYLLASATEADVTPYKTDDDITSVTVSSFEPKAFHDGDGPQVNGTVVKDIEVPLLKSLELTGEVWFAFYTGATGGIYKIGNVKFIQK